MILLVVEGDLGEYVPGLRVEGERYVVRGEVRYLGVDALVGVLGAHAPYELAGLALAHLEFVRQALEFRVLVVYVGHLDVDRGRARQAARVLRFDYLFRGGDEIGYI